MTLDSQINEFNHKVQENEDIIREWSTKSKKQGSEKKVKRTRKINETSPQNVLVESLSPDMVITNDQRTKCEDCYREIYS